MNEHDTWYRAQMQQNQWNQLMGQAQIQNHYASGLAGLGQSLGGRPPQENAVPINHEPSKVLLLLEEEDATETV